MSHFRSFRLAPLAAAAVLVACGDDSVPIPQLTPATPGTLQACAGLASAFSFANTAITGAADVAAGVLTVP